MSLCTGVRGETVWKSERGRSMTYAPGHEKELFDRSLRHRVGMHRALPPASPQARTTEDPRHPRSPRRHLLRTEERLPLAPTTEGFPAVGDRLLVVREVALREGTFERLNALTDYLKTLVIGYHLRRPQEKRCRYVRAKAASYYLAHA